MNYDLNYFLKKFAAIPDHKWTTGTFQFEGQKCAMGHCLPDDYIEKINNAGVVYELHRTTPKCLYKPTAEECKTVLKELYELAKLIDPQSPNNGTEQIILINNGYHPNYKQKTPKARILAALHDVKKLQEKDQKPKEVKERIVYVTVPEVIMEQVKELIQN